MKMVLLDADKAGTTNVRIRSENGVEQDREMLTVTESGLYRLIFKSRKPMRSTCTETMID